MMRRFLFLAIAAFTAPSFAQTSANAASLSGATSTSGAQAISGSTYSGAAALQGNAQNIIFNSSVPPSQTQNVNYSGSIEHSGTSTLKTVPMVYAPPMGVTAPCRIALSGGLSVVGVGVSGGGSVEDLKCNWRENARISQSSGDPQAAQHWNIALARLECLEATEIAFKALKTICDKVGVPAPGTVEAVPQPVAAVSPAPVIAAPQSKECRKEIDKGITTITCPM